MCTQRGIFEYEHCRPGIVVERTFRTLTARRQASISPNNEGQGPLVAAMPRAAAVTVPPRRSPVRLPTPRRLRVGDWRPLLKARKGEEVGGGASAALHLGCVRHRRAYVPGEGVRGAGRRRGPDRATLPAATATPHRVGQVVGLDQRHPLMWIERMVGGCYLTSRANASEVGRPLQSRICSASSSLPPCSRRASSVAVATTTLPLCAFLPPHPVHPCHC